MLHGGGVIIAQHRIPGDTSEITQVSDLLGPVGLTGAVVTADAARARRGTAEYIAGKRGADDLLTVKGSRPRLQRAISDKVSADRGAGPGHVAIDRGHGRVICRSIWAASAGGTDFPARRPGHAHPPRHLRPRRDPAGKGDRPRDHHPGRRLRHP
jgi:hypothetical protein